jgi:type I restriction enzyme S subunit
MAGGLDPRLTEGWLPPLPRGWVAERLANRAWIRARLGWRGLTAGEYVDDGVPMLSTPDIKGDRLSFEGVNRISPDRYEESPEIKLRIGDVLLTKDGATIGIVNVVTRLPEPATVNGSIAVITPDCTVEPRYLRYSLASGYAQQVMTLLQGGMGVPHLFQADIKRIVLPFPPFRDQTVIADFLDRETSTIDRLIEKQKRMVLLSLERRQATIDGAFTSNDESQRIRLRTLLTARPSYGVLVPGYVVGASEDGVPLVRVADLSQLEASTLPLISREQSDEYSRTSLRGGEVLLGVVGKMGHAIVAPKSLAGANTARAVAVLRCRSDSDAELLSAWLSSTPFLLQAELATGGDTIQPTLGMADLARMDIDWPAKAGAVSRTATLIKERIARLEVLAASAERLVRLSEERRAALITAAVTGQLDVTTRKVA